MTAPPAATTSSRRNARSSWNIATEALKRWEPRVQVEAVEVQADASDAESALATITYRLVATQVQERVSLRVGVSA